MLLNGSGGSLERLNNLTGHIFISDGPNINLEGITLDSTVMCDLL